MSNREVIGWTAPYCRVQHLLRRPESKGRWATVTDWDLFAELDGWYPGCAFSPYNATFDSIEEARAAGERWVSEGVFPHGEQRQFFHAPTTSPNGRPVQTPLVESGTTPRRSW